MGKRTRVRTSGNVEGRPRINMIFLSFKIQSSNNLGINKYYHENTHRLQWGTTGKLHQLDGKGMPRKPSEDLLWESGMER